MSERVQLTIDNHVATVRMSRPEKRNALDADMFDGLLRMGKRIIADNSVRAVVLHGEGKAFSAGLDFASFLGAPDLMQKLLARGEESPANLAQRAGWIWQEVNVPVIAAVHGFAFGGGLQIALGADLRYVTADAQFSVMEIKWGLIPDMSITQTLLRLVPIDVAKELTFTGRIVSGTEAVELGLATKVSSDPLAAALETAHLILLNKVDQVDKVAACHPRGQNAPQRCAGHVTCRRAQARDRPASRTARQPQSNGGGAGEHDEANAFVQRPGIVSRRSSRLGRPRHAGLILAAIRRTLVAVRASLAQSLPHHDLAQALLDELTYHRHEGGVGPHRGRPRQGDSELVGVVPGLVIEIPDHLHVVRQEPDRRDHHVFHVDL